MRAESKATIGILGTLGIAIALGWFWIHTHLRFNVNTSALNADHDFLVFCIAGVAFVAGGLSFSRSPTAGLIVRTLVALWALAATALAAYECFSLWPIPGVVPALAGNAHPGLLVSGVALLALYFLATFASTLPVVSPRLLARLGVLLHFGLLLLIDVLSMHRESWFTFFSFGYHLALGLGFALLSMRMYERRLALEAGT